MILKKPYAFLIKHFKLIHLILFTIILFTTYRFSIISDFFSTYVKNNNTVGVTIPESYIPNILFIAYLLIIIFSSLMWLLMLKKEKPNKFYLFTSIYYFILLLSTMYAYNTINSLADVTLNIRASRALRDIYQILLFPNIYFIIVSLIRGIGFDVKKFNFKADLEELEIKSEDNEEFEFVLGKDSYKWKRKIRRYFRELKYYFLENKFFLTIIIIAIISIIFIILLINNTFNKKTYYIGETMKTDSITYKLKNAYITSYDLTGKKLKEDKKYLVLDFLLSSSSSKAVIRTEDFYLLKNNNIYNFKSSLVESFSDLGTTYQGDLLTSTTKNYIFIFEIENNLKGKYTLNIFDKVEYKNNDAKYLFKIYKFTPIDLDKNFNKQESNLNELLTFDSSIFGHTTLKIKNININSSFTYKTNKCDEKNDCNLENTVIFPTDTLKYDLVTIEYELDIDKESTIYNNQKAIFKTFSINYLKDNKKYTATLYPKNITNLKNIIVADIPKIVSNSTDNTLIISTRNDKHTIKLK